MSEADPFINMHCVYDTLDALKSRKQGVFRINLSQAPHTQEGQKVGVDYAREEIVDRYRDMLQKTVQGQLNKDVRFEEVLDGPNLYEYRVWLR